MLTDQATMSLREALIDADFTVDGVTSRLGAEATAALGRNTTISAERELAGADDSQATLIRLLLLQRTVPEAAAIAALGPLDALAPIIGRNVGGVRALLDLRPYAVEGLIDGWVASDLIPTLDGRNDPLRPDFVLGISPASTTLAQLAIRRPVGRALDLGTGCGVQALHLAGHCASVVATDLNPRALELAHLTAGLNQVSLDLRLGSLYEPVAAETFDLILTNPPYVMAPPGGQRLIYREGGFSGDELVRRVVTGAPARLNPDGVLQVLGNWAITANQDWVERLTSWIFPTGCDGLVLMRERLDPAEYVELWLADAGLANAPDYPARYAAWLDYFDSLGIVGVGMGWLALYNTGREQPEVRVEDWPHQVHQPVGAAFADFPQALSWAQRSDQQLLDARWRLDPAVVQEALGRPGADDPEHVVLRSGTGFGRALRVDTALGGVLGACDGDLSLGELLAAVAELLDADEASLRGEVLAGVRRSIIEGMLHPAGG